MAERRKYPRFELKMNAKYKLKEQKGAFEAGKTRNISAEGLCFESDKKLDIGTCVNLEVDLEDGEKIISLFGEIRWSSAIKSPDSKKTRYLNGVKLIDIPKSDEGRFLKYYCDRMVEKLSGYLKM